SRRSARQLPRHCAATAGSRTSRRPTRACRRCTTPSSRRCRKGPPLSRRLARRRPRRRRSCILEFVTCWNSAEHTHSLRQMNWMASTAVLMHLNERATGDPARDWLSSWAHRYFVGQDLRVLVLGCGEGWLERAVSEWPFVSRIDALDFAEAAVARARARGGPKIRYSVADLNRDTLEAGAYDVVVAHSILHHVEKLEHAFEQVERAMKPEATFIVNEYIGPNRFQFSDEILAIINDLLRCLPAQLRQGALEDRVYEARERPTIDQMIANDPSEAVRASDLMPMIRQRFDVVAVRQLGGTMLMHLLYDIVQKFALEDP